MLRAIALLKSFTRHRPVHSLSGLCEEHRLSRTTAHRLLAALESEDLIARDPVDLSYRLGPGTIALGAQARLDSDLLTVVQPELELLASETGETATLEILAQDQMLILSEVKGRHLVTVAPETGTMWPLHTTSTGKAILSTLSPQRRRELIPSPLTRFTPSTITGVRAFLREVEAARDRGYATASGEIEPGAAAVAVALLDAQGAARAAISLGGPVSRLSPDRMKQLGTTLKSRAVSISQRLNTAIH